MKRLGRVLVTGGAGYIGSHACQALHSCGLEPVAYDNLSRGFKSNVQWGPLVEGDILDTELLAQTLRDFKMGAVIHFAGLSSVPESVEQPELYLRTNTLGTKSLLEAMDESGCRRLIFSSSCSVYGGQRPLIDERVEPNPLNPYGTSKLMAEQAIEEWSDRHAGKTAVALRYFNVAGVEPGSGIQDGAQYRIVPQLLKAARGESSHVPIYGNDYPTKDGTAVRDYVHVSDLVQAHLSSLQFLLDEMSDGFDVFNVSYGVGHSLRDLIQAVEEQTRQKLNVVFYDRRPGDPAQLVGSSSKLQARMQWEPRYSDMKKIISSLLDSQRSHQPQPKIFPTL